MPTFFDDFERRKFLETSTAKTQSECQAAHERFIKERTDEQLISAAYRHVDIGDAQEQCAECLLHKFSYERCPLFDPIKRPIQ